MLSQQSNVLIDDGLHARLCDFGLSMLLLEGCQDDNISVQSVYTSHLGGSVRWADASLFRSLEGDTPPIIGTPNDIYSFGSVMLEVANFFWMRMFPVIHVWYRYYQAACRTITFGPTLRWSSNYIRALNRGGLLRLLWMKINGALFKNVGRTHLRIGHLRLECWS